MARTAYSPVNTAIRSPQSIEHEAIARITRDLKAAMEKGREGFNALVHALHENRRLWTVLAASVSDPDNALPNDLRARIFYLSEFTVAHSRRVLKQEADASVLIEINSAIMRGLRMQGSRE